MRQLGSLRPSVFGLAVAATVAVVSISPRAWCAAAPDESAASQAKRHYEEGTKAFNLGEFARAITEFKATYNAKPDPLLLFNIAQSYRLAGDAGQALFFYKSFLRNMPEATSRKEVEAQIRKLEKQLQTEDQKRETSAVSPSGAVPGVVVPLPPATPPPLPVIAAPESPQSASRPVSSPSSSSSPSPSLFAPAAPQRIEPEGHAGAVDTTPRPPKGETAQVDLTQPASPPQEEDRPIYKKWWFWAGAGSAVLIIGGVAAANAKKGPSTTLGLYTPKFR